MSRIGILGPVAELRLCFGFTSNFEKMSMPVARKLLVVKAHSHGLIATVIVVIATNELYRYRW